MKHYSYTPTHTTQTYYKYIVLQIKKKINKSFQFPLVCTDYFNKHKCLTMKSPFYPFPIISPTAWYSWVLPQQQLWVRQITPTNKEVLCCLESSTFIGRNLSSLGQLEDVYQWRIHFQNLQKFTILKENIELDLCLPMMNRIFMADCTQLWSLVINMLLLFINLESIPPMKLWSNFKLTFNFYHSYFLYNQTDHSGILHICNFFPIRSVIFKIWKWTFSSNY